MKIIDVHAPIIPFVGVGDILLNTHYREVKAILKNNKVKHNDQVKTVKGEYWGNVNIYTGNNAKHETISLSFAKGKLTEITLWEEYEGTNPPLKVMGGFYNEIV